MKPDDHKIVATRLREILSAAAESKPSPYHVSMGVNPTGHWDMDVDFVRGTSRHALDLQLERGRLVGSHTGTSARGNIEGSLSGDRVRFRSTLPVEGMRLVYTFDGAISGDSMAGKVDLGEYGSATWKASRKAI